MTRFRTLDDRGGRLRRTALPDCGGRLRRTALPDCGGRLRRTARPRWARCAAVLGAFAAGCGSGAPPEARSPDDSPSSDAESVAREPDGNAEAEPESGASDEAPASACDDGSCFACGDGICPAGWYCHENAPGGAACSWLPACAERAECGCITSALGSECSCEKRDGGAHVTCG